MIVYQFLLPLQTNDKSLSYACELYAWEQRALQEAGGFTDLGVRRGVWRDPETGKTYDEQMACYQVAFLDCLAEAKVKELTEAAFELFTDQLAFYVAQVGTADIAQRESAERVTEAHWAATS